MPIETRIKEIEPDSCQACDWVLDQHGTCTGCGLSGLEATHTALRSIVAFKPCPKCANQVPINGPIERVHCDRCSATISLVEDWKSAGSMLQWLLVLRSDMAIKTTNQMAMGTDWKTTEKFAAPLCHGCSQPLIAAAIPLDTDGAIRCRHCGSSTAVFPAPGWLREIHCVQQIFGATARDVAGTNPAPASGQAAPSQPVVLRCNGCGGNLTVTSSTERVFVCQYCQAQAFVPDELWRIMHPVATADTWFVRLDLSSGAGVQSKAVESRVRDMRDQGATAAQMRTEIARIRALELTRARELEAEAEAEDSGGKPGFFARLFGRKS